MYLAFQKPEVFRQMCTPTKQPYADVEIVDDPGIEDTDLLIRYLRSPWQIKQRATGEWKISPQAFKEKRSTSIDIACLIERDTYPILHRLGRMPDTYAAIAVQAVAARIHANGAAWTPKPRIPDKPGTAGEPNPYHGEVIGPISSDASRQLLKLSKELAAVRSDGLPYPHPDVIDSTAV